MKIFHALLPVILLGKPAYLNLLPLRTDHIKQSFEMASCAKNSASESSEIPGDPRTFKSRVLESGAAMAQDFTPVKQICAHLNAFHVYADDPTRCVESNHYCTHLTEGKYSVHEVYPTKIAIN